MKKYNGGQQLKWSDGSLWDFGETFFEFPWLDSPPEPDGEGDCIQTRSLGGKPNALWTDQNCDNPSYFLCNSPYQQHDDLVLIWKDEMDEVNNEWTMSDNNDAQFALSDVNCPNKDGQSLHLTYGSGYIEKTTDITDYEFIELQVDIRAVGLEENNFCQIWYTFNKNDQWIQANNEYVNGMYPNQIINFQPFLSNMITIILQTSGDAGDVTDQCFWDNVILRGNKKPTEHPTRSGTSTSSISPINLIPSPTDFPTWEPTQKPTFPVSTSLDSSNKWEATTVVIVVLAVLSVALVCFLGIWCFVNKNKKTTERIEIRSIEVLEDVEVQEIELDVSDEEFERGIGVSICKENKK